MSRTIEIDNLNGGSRSKGEIIGIYEFMSASRSVSYELIYRLYAIVTALYLERTSVYTLLTSLPVYILITSLYSGLG